jgi:hypothetical protein
MCAAIGGMGVPDEKEAAGGIPFLSWFDGPIKQSINSVFQGLNASVEALDLFGKFHRAHLETLKHEVQHIKLLGMSQPANLAEIYNAARVSTTIKRRLYAAEWFKADGGSITAAEVKAASKGAVANTIDGDAFIEKTPRVVVLGGPGAGKTTFLKYLGLAYTDKAVFEKSSLKRSKLPFFVTLPLLHKTGEELFDFLVAPIKAKTSQHAEAFLKRILEKGQAVLLLDSLDEVPKSGRPELLCKIKAFCKQFPAASIIVSCRTADYTEPLESFSEVEIAKLDKTSVQKIIRAWFANDPAKAKSLCDLTQHDRGIASLTETPLLLSLLCIQFRHDLSLPKRKVELFKRCSETLLREWDTTRGFRRDSAYETLTDQTKERLFEKVAGHFTVEAATVLFSKAKLIEIISDFCSKVGLPPSDAPGILQEIDQHHGILEQFSQEHYGFSHTSFQDYFTARYVLAKRIEKQILTKHLDNPDWHPIVEFMIAMADDPSEMIEYLISKSDLKGLTNYPPMAKRTSWLHLLYRCLATSPYLTPQLKAKAIAHLIDSQIEIARIYGEGGVYPVSQLTEDGIRHPYFFTNKRTSLSTALQPFRELANEILQSDVPGYSDAVFNALPALPSRIDSDGSLLLGTLIMNLVTPLARTDPMRVAEVLKAQTFTKGTGLHNLIPNTLRAISNGS